MLEIISKNKQLKILYRKIKVGTITFNGGYNVIDYKNNTHKFEKLNDALSYFINFNWTSIIPKSSGSRTNTLLKTKNYKRWSKD